MATHRQASSTESRIVTIPACGVLLDADLRIPARAKGVVAFAHGSGSSRFSPRNQFVPRVLEEAGLATLIFDLLTGDEEGVDRLSAHLRFDIELLAERLIAATDWLSQ